MSEDNRELKRLIAEQQDACEIHLKEAESLAKKMVRAIEKGEVINSAYVEEMERTLANLRTAVTSAKASSFAETAVVKETAGKQKVGATG